MITLPFWRGMGERQARWDVPAHPFYRRWAEGELRGEDLATYASEYEHAVTATAVTWRRAEEIGGARFERRASAAEDRVRLWRRFAKQAGWGGWGAWGYGEEPLPETVECTLVWVGDVDRGLPEHLVTLAAIEALSSVTCRLKLAALLDHYGFEDGPATEYLWRHAVVDDEESLLARGLFDEEIAGADPVAMLDQVEAVHRAHWLLLDGVEALGARA